MRRLFGRRNSNYWRYLIMAQTIQEGERFQYTATGAVANGELKVVNRMAGVALTAATLSLIHI